MSDEHAATATFYRSDGRFVARCWARSMAAIERRLAAPELADVVQANAVDVDGTVIEYARPQIGGAWVVTRFPKKDGA